ncbi:MAG: acyl-CoA thioesterase [Legionellales bacterium]|nr:acyl-CoA thioesterase [Legionellales bacterium]
MKTYHFNYKVRLNDIDFMGIVGHAQWLTILMEARLHLLQEVGMPFAQMLKENIGGVVAEAQVKYLKPAYYDDNLSIMMNPHTPFNKGLFIKYTVVNQQQQDCLQADLKLVFVDNTGKPVAMPEKIVQEFF